MQTVFRDGLLKAIANNQSWMGNMRFALLRSRISNAVGDEVRAKLY